jgi:hypothetical protein
MADSKQFEEMLECLVNEDKVKAEELFHNIVVEKSREIYENLLEDDLDDEEVDETSDEEVDEASDDEEVDEASDEEVDEASEDDDLEEDFNLDEFEVEGEDDMDMDAGDPADAMMSDIADMGDEEGEGGDEPEGDVEERVGDLEDALDELKAEFEDMMAGEEGGEDDDAEMPADDDMDTDSDDEEGDDEEMPEASDEEVDETSDDEVEEGSKEELSPTEQMREYVEKITPKMGDNGANTKSTVAGANNMGNGTASNLAQGADEKGMKAASPKDIASGNVNVPGGKASKSMTTNAKGHGAEKKGAGDTAANKKSTIGS